MHIHISAVSILVFMAAITDVKRSMLAEFTGVLHDSLFNG